ncbi:asparagine synthase (glutamine-hydrolyzing) [Sediminicurvatus halobius]|uniref:asparagine synthase (glutamine-hydrolyzing) n=1 Tax=Sediminicurvatus halobius TaxID=2182432 RepID=A0A2U2N741_9GAMM|nr:asparagine synthase (glutamine-hydrolyzing) [Spiribacter halobius]PWG64903.1 asparagine synthase (glutamine-hydrolyzing) [Spiribacter halobius]UEX78241.1 asparagine synthase (glutamine-hydrolyzing) [Spiribacter halobius]
MCGIAGLCLRDAVDPGALAPVLAALAHRGPDDRGVWAEGSIGLAHTRLSIIDLAGGHQPITSDDGRLVLVANGEIYNHVELRTELEAMGYRFRTHSDCEVIVQGYLAWGEAVLERLHGMFAFALRDGARGAVLLARDRLGIKPLFLRRRGDGFAFGSELKALRPLAGRPEVNPEGLAEYFAHQFAAGPRTLWADTERVLPGEALWLRDGAIERRWQYWRARDVRPASLSLGEAEEAFDGLFEQVLREHLRSDVPIGLFLSGGVDSSILCARLPDLHNEPLEAYGVGFQGHGMTDELPLAQAVAGRFGVAFHPVRPPIEALLGALPASVWAADELMRDFASLPTLLLAEGAAGRHKVIFSGEGGDEAFAGYGRYHPGRLETLAKRLLRPGSGGFRTRGTVPGRLKRALYGDALLSADRASRDPFIRAWQEAPGDWSDLQRRQYVDLMTALPDNLLVKADRMLMHHGIEGRVPFLDHRVVEFGLALPDHLKVRDGQGKWFLKHWASRYLDRGALFARKRGFHVPFRSQVAGERLARLGRALPDHPAVRAHLRPQGVRRLLAADARADRLSQAGFAVFQFALWHRMFIDGDGARPDAGADPIALIEEAS